MTPEQLRAAQDAALATATHSLRRHPYGLAGRVADALTDAELIAADPGASLQAKQAAHRFAQALVAALLASPD
jgi:hypothetical protein